MVSDAVAVPSDGHDVAVVQHAVDERGCHYLVAEDVAPFLKALVARQHRRGPFVAPGHQLEEEHGSALEDGQVPDLVDDQRRGMREHFEALIQVVRRLCLF